MELVLPGAYYYIQMQDGRMEVHGTVQQLQQDGLLEDLEVSLINVESTPISLQEEEYDHGLDEILGSKAVSDQNPSETQVAGPDLAWIKTQREHDKHRKRPRKLIEEEARQIGGVQWTIYETYLRASYESCAHSLEIILINPPEVIIHGVSSSFSSVSLSCLAFLKR